MDMIELVNVQQYFSLFIIQMIWSDLLLLNGWVNPGVYVCPCVVDRAPPGVNGVWTDHVSHNVDIHIKPTDHDRGDNEVHGTLGLRHTAGLYTRPYTTTALGQVPP